jgi:tRNA modification GTPase
MNASDSDTIVAIATAAGEGAIGIIRLSGSRAVSISTRCFRGRQPLDQLPARTLSYGHFYNQGQNLDEILAAVMYAPHSYTGEDTVEFNCHGGPFLLRRFLDMLVREGARPALPGEFTKRAFLNGRIDLSQAEAVADMISAKSDFGLQSAYFQLRGGLRTRFEAMSESLRHAAMLLEAGLDFSEDVEIDLTTIVLSINEGLSLIENLISSYQRGKIIREGALVTIAGRPNVGKSSLLNRLLEQDRAIVTPNPGTTRDTIEEQIELDGIVATLADTAGLRATQDPVEKEGTERSRQSIERSVVVLYIVDCSLPPLNEDLEHFAQLPHGFLVLNKSDLLIHADWQSASLPKPYLFISAKTADGIPLLRSRLREALIGRGDPPCEIITRERHLISLECALDGLKLALHSLDRGNPGELIAMDLRIALDALADIVGETTPDDVLDRIFSTFCIGK